MDMTWKQLLLLLKNMEAVEHSCLDNPVEVICGGSFFTVDVIESLTRGSIYLTADVRDDDQSDAQEDDDDN